MDAHEGAIALLQRLVDGYPEDATAVHAAARDEALPAAARKLLIGALNYGLDALDLFPDHFRGLGLADDAIVLRLAAAQALATGTRGPALERLAREARDLRPILEELMEPLERMVAALPDREVHGRTADRILADPTARQAFHAEVQRDIARSKPGRIDTSGFGPAGTVDELRKMIRHGLKRGGWLGAT